MKTNSDIPEWTCFSCRYAGDTTFMFNEQECVECRRNHPGGSGFPIMSIHSWCWDGQLSKTFIQRLKTSNGE